MVKVVVDYKSAMSVLEGSKTKASLAAERIVRKGSVIIANNAKREFRARPLGSQRTSKRTGRVYYAGAPLYPAQSERPTNRTGNLSASIGTRDVIRTGYGRWESLTGPSLRYAPYVEYGTSSSRPFPYMTPGFEKSKAALEELAAREWKTVTE